MTQRSCDHRVSGVYMDASALAKLVFTEPETPALRQYLSTRVQVMASRLASVEVQRVARRQAERDADQQVDALLGALLVIELGPEVARAAGTALPSSLRSLDAIHLASALSVGENLESLITYDHRLADAARAAGLTVEAPA